MSTRPGYLAPEICASPLLSTYCCLTMGESTADALRNVFLKFVRLEVETECEEPDPKSKGRLQLGRTCLKHERD
jgi:hypothetical protein